MPLKPIQGPELSNMYEPKKIQNYISFDVNTYSFISFQKVMTAYIDRNVDTPDN